MPPDRFVPIRRLVPRGTVVRDQMKKSSTARAGTTVKVVLAWAVSCVESMSSICTAWAPRATPVQTIGEVVPLEQPAGSVEKFVTYGPLPPTIVQAIVSDSPTSTSAYATLSRTPGSGLTVRVPLAIARRPSESVTTALKEKTPAAVGKQSSVE